MKPSIGEGSSVRPGSWTEAKAQDGLPGNLGDPAHVHVRASRQSGRRLNMDPGPEGTLRPSGSASASCETQTEEGSGDDLTGCQADRRTPAVELAARAPAKGRGVAAPGHRSHIVNGRI